MGDRLRSRRHELGLTLREVAEIAGLSLPYVSNLERGKGNPTLDALRKLARALDLDLGDLVDETPEESDPIATWMADVPASLMRFRASDRYRLAVARLAKDRSEPFDDLDERIFRTMVAAPRRASGEPTETDWLRMLDTFRLILSD